MFCGRKPFFQWCQTVYHGTRFRAWPTTRPTCHCLASASLTPLNFEPLSQITTHKYVIDGNGKITHRKTRCSLKRVLTSPNVHFDQEHTALYAVDKTVIHMMVANYAQIIKFSVTLISGRPTWPVCTLNKTWTWDRLSIGMGNSSTPIVELTASDSTFMVFHPQQTHITCN